MLTRRELLGYGVSAGMLGKVLASSATGVAAGTGAIELMLQTRDKQGLVRTTTEHVDPRKIAIIAVDCWHFHWCRTWRSRAGSLIPRFNHSFERARKLGMTLIFSPTNAMRDLNESPQRKATLALPNHPLPALMNLPDPYPGAIRYGMCECGLGEACFYNNNVNNQHPDLKMTTDDFIALTQQEAFNILKERRITQIIYTGFATNMCMWGKPTGMKYMRQFGFHCSFARDMTEAITGYLEEGFNPTRGTIEVIELVERDLAPSINMEQTLRKAGVWDGEPVLDYVHLAPWGRLFGGEAYPIPVQVELTCRHVPGAELRYTLDGGDPTAASPLYRAPIKIENTTLLKVAGFKGERPVTRVSEAKYWKYPPWPDPPQVFISDLQPLHELVGEIKPNSYAVKKAARFNRSVEGHVLTNRDRKFCRGIGVQAPSELVFPLEPKYKRFVATVGVDDECMRWDNPDGLAQWPQWSRPIHGPTSYRICQIIFEVIIDGKTMTETPPLFNGVLGWGIDVEIPQGAQQITLKVKDVESRITDPHGHGDWLDAGFISS
ncbi:MAG: NPCBM/NEW2 domain-containing protein [Acidobacteriia bacterium]|nr:NPCBM/NEW2 domain-containing protein [Terriglobia bacterium]